MTEFEDIVAQLTRYGGEPWPEVLPILQALADLNDDLQQLMHWKLVEEKAGAIRRQLSELVAKYRVDQEGGQ